MATGNRMQQETGVFSSLRWRRPTTQTRPMPTLTQADVSLFTITSRLVWPRSWWWSLVINIIHDNKSSWRTGVWKEEHGQAIYYLFCSGQLSVLIFSCIGSFVSHKLTLCPVIRSQVHSDQQPSREGLHRAPGGRRTSGLQCWRALWWPTGGRI